MFQRAFHRFHNAVDCTIFGAKKPVVLRVLNSKVSHEQSNEGAWESHDHYHQSSSNSSSKSSSTSSSHRCSIAFLIRQLSVFTAFPKCVNLDEVESGNDQLIHFINRINLRSGSRYSRQSLTPHEIKFSSLFFANNNPFTKDSYLPKTKASFLNEMLPTTESSSSALNFLFSSIVTTENPQLPQFAEVGSESKISASSSTVSQSIQTSAPSYLSTFPTDTSKIENVSIHLPEGHYKGGILNGLQHGHGTFIYANGDTYSGEWQNGLAHGHGRMIYSNLGMYDGHWKDGQRHGIGLYIPLENDVYVGEWYENARQGYGRQFSSVGDLLYDGQWNNNDRNGSGIGYFGKQEMYKGEWLNGKMHGQGRWTRGEFNDLLWEGEWENGTNVRGVWHVDAYTPKELIGESETSDSYSPEPKLRTLPQPHTHLTRKNETLTQPKVIIVHGVEPKDQIVVQYRS